MHAFGIGMRIENVKLGILINVEIKFIVEVLNKNVKNIIINILIYLVEGP